jgi:hypothetical protein
MLDVIYVIVMVVFFALMLVYVRACARLGHDRHGGDAREESR